MFIRSFTSAAFVTPIPTKEQTDCHYPKPILFNTGVRLVSTSSDDLSSSLTQPAGCDIPVSMDCPRRRHSTVPYWQSGRHHCTRRVHHHGWASHSVGSLNVCNHRPSLILSIVRLSAANSSQRATLAKIFTSRSPDPPIPTPTTVRHQKSTKFNATRAQAQSLDLVGSPLQICTKLLTVLCYRHTTCVH